MATAAAAVAALLLWLRSAIVAATADVATVALL